MDKHIDRLVIGIIISLTAVAFIILGMFVIAATLQFGFVIPLFAILLVGLVYSAGILGEKLGL